MAFRIIITVFIMAFAAINSALALEVIANDNTKDTAALENDIALLKSLTNAMNAKFTEQISTTKDSLSQAQEDLSFLRTCNDKKKAYNPTKSGADENGCVDITSEISVVPNLAGYAKINTTGTKNVTLGNHDFCTFALYSGPGGLNTHSIISPQSYTQAKPAWHMWVADYDNAKTHIIAANCLDFVK